MSKPEFPPRADIAAALAPLALATSSRWLVAWVLASALLTLRFPLLGFGLAIAFGAVLGAVRRAGREPTRTRAPLWLIGLVCLSAGSWYAELGPQRDIGVVRALWSLVAASIAGIAPPPMQLYGVRVWLPMVAAAVTLVAYFTWSPPMALAYVTLGTLLLGFALALPSGVLLALLWHSEAVRGRWLWAAVTGWLVLGAALVGWRSPAALTVLEAVFATLVVWIAGGVARTLREQAAVGETGGDAATVVVLSAAQRSPWATAFRVALLGSGITLLLAASIGVASTARTLSILLLGSALTGAVAMHLTAGAQRASDRAAPWAAVAVVSTAPVVLMTFVSPRAAPQAMALTSVLSVAAGWCGAFVASRVPLSGRPIELSQPVLVLLGLLACAPAVGAWTALPGVPGLSLATLFLVVGAPVALTLVARTLRPRGDWLLGALALGLFAATVDAVISGRPLGPISLAPFWVQPWLLAACVAAVCARARSITAVPADHPIFVDFPRQES